MNNFEKEVIPSEGSFEKVPPIMTCIGTVEDFREYLPESFDAMRMLDGEADRRAQTISPDIDNVSWKANDEDKKEAGLLSGGSREYVISPLNSNNKFSSGLYSCLCLVVVGKSRITNKNISTMLHTPLYNPADDVDGKSLGGLINSLDPQLNALKEECIDGSIDSVIAGGLINKRYEAWDTEHYTDMKDFLSERVKRVCGITPVHVGGPKKLDTTQGKDTEQVADDVYFENDTRRLFLLRPECTKSRE